eukprot:421528-Lingulodinium_polyedra.AAC.1
MQVEGETGGSPAATRAPPGAGDPRAPAAMAVTTFGHEPAQCSESACSLGAGLTVVAPEAWAGPSPGRKLQAPSPTARGPQMARVPAVARPARSQ